MEKVYTTTFLSIIRRKILSLSIVQRFFKREIDGPITSLIRFFKQLYPFELRVGKRLAEEGGVHCLSPLPYNKAAICPLIWTQCSRSPRIHNPPPPPFFPPPGYYRGERGRGISLASDTPKHPLPILHCPWQSAILPFHLAPTLVRPDILSLPLSSPTIRWRNREPEISFPRHEWNHDFNSGNEILFSKTVNEWRKNIMSMYTRYFEVFLERAHVVVSRFYYHARSYVSIKTRNSPPTRSSTHIFPLLLHIYPHLFIHPFRRVLFVRVKI